LLDALQEIGKPGPEATAASFARHLTVHLSGESHDFHNIGRGLDSPRSQLAEVALLIVREVCFKLRNSLSKADVRLQPRSFLDSFGHDVQFLALAYMVRPVTAWERQLLGGMPSRRMIARHAKSPLERNLDDWSPVRLAVLAVSQSQGELQLVSAAM
jgi:hypothetical protein